MDQSKILRIYGDILPKKSYDNGTIVPTTEKLHVKHYSNSKINNYLYKIQKNEWFERNREEVTPKTISEVNNLFNQNNQNGDWAPTEANLHPHWGTNTDQERPSHGQDTGWNAPDDSDDSFYSSTTESPRVRVNHHKNKKRQDSSYYNTEDNGQTNKKSSDWSSQVNNFVTTPQEPRPQYSTIKYKQHKTKYENLAHEGKNNVKNIFDDWSTPRSMSAYSEWLTTPETYTTPNSKPNWVSSEPSNNWSPAHQESNWVTITTPKPAAEHLSTSGPDLDEFIARQENRYKKYNSLYSGVNSYGDLSQDILTQPRDYRQTPNSNSNYNPNILKDQFDIPPNIQSYDPYSEYQDYSSSTSFNPYSSTDNFVSSTTKRPSFKENNHNNNNFQTIYRPQGPSLNNVNFENNNRFIRNNFNEQNKRPSDFGEPETVIENKYQTTLKKHFDNTINLYESQITQEPISSF
ncbi:GATA zinc finger domain-containing protein 14-like [Diaphorina citri]|uniref:GATA zinc finger domain-containing protein 14-like n=1 Tax=Diaphorina citri TaxID=121845 RepID=A0A1S3DIR4_DIACI|nr:GATA zinc finger domain-containing protein 14-like [Diaphorina citri]